MMETMETTPPREGAVKGWECVSALVSAAVSLLPPAAPEEEGARGAAGGRDPGLREDSHGEEQPPERPGQDGQSFLSSLSLRTCHPDGGI